MEGVVGSFHRSAGTGKRTPDSASVVLQASIITEARHSARLWTRFHSVIRHMTSRKHIVVAGSTGEVGKHLVRLASARPDLAVHALVRRKGARHGDSAIDEIVFDYEDPEAYRCLFRDVPCDVLLIALGTTTAKAGVEGLLRVDRDYPLSLIEALERIRPHARVGFCSSAGADHPRGHYLRAKAAVEQRLQTSSLTCVIARPSFLISDRTEFRPVEKFGVPLFRAGFGLFRMLMPHSSFVWKYGPVRADGVAEQLLAATLDVQASQHLILEGERLHRTN